MDVPVGEPAPDLARHLDEDGFVASVPNVVDGVEPQTVETKFLQPIEHIVDEELTHRLALEGDGAAPRRAALRIEEVRRVEMEIIPLRPEMIIDDVEHDHEPALVSRIDQTLQTVRAAISRVRRIEQHAVIAPAAIAGELGHRHDLYCRDAHIGEPVQVAGDTVETAFG